MKKHYVTFGQDHRHIIDNVIFDKDCVAVFETETSTKGREEAFRLFGAKFCFEYHGDEFNQESLRYFPLGFVEVPRA